MLGGSSQKSCSGLIELSQRLRFSLVLVGALFVSCRYVGMCMWLVKCEVGSQHMPVKNFPDLT